MAKHERCVIYKDHAAAEQVRIQLLRDGFPTDRIELTSASEPGRAATEPGTSAHNRYLQYFERAEEEKATTPSPAESGR